MAVAESCRDGGHTVPSPAEPVFHFRPVTVLDLPMLNRWLHQPHVARWWRDSLSQLRAMRDGLPDRLTTRLVVEADGVPFAYLQHHRVHDDLDDHHRGLPTRARAMDTFLGEPSMLGRGLGRRYLRAQADAMLAAGAPLVSVDPELANRHAVRVWRRAGFRERRIVPARPGPKVLMVFDGEIR